jgi:hypothetical protein
MCRERPSKFRSMQVEVHDVPSSCMKPCDSRCSSQLSTGGSSGPRNGIIQDSAYSAVWAGARKQTLAEAQYRSPLGRRPRRPVPHGGVTGAELRGARDRGRPPRGHSAAVPLKIDTHCFDGQASAANKRINDALSAPSRAPLPMRATTTTSRQPEMPGQGPETGRCGRCNRSHQGRPCPVRGFQGTGLRIHGRIADGGGPEACLETNNRRSAASDPCRRIVL